MLYLLAIVLPPVAVLVAGKPFQALLNLLLTLLFYFPGLIHALFVVHNHYADKRTDRLIAATSAAGVPAAAANGRPSAAPPGPGARPWYRTKRFLIGAPVLAVVILAIVGAALAPPADPEDDGGLTAGTVANDTSRAISTAAPASATTEPAPTPSPTPEPTPEPPIVLEGSGDDVIDVVPAGPRLARITGNAAGAYFGMIPYTGSERGSSLVNTTDPYEGIVPIDFLEGEATDSIEVQATGPWRIELLPLSAARPIDGALSGTGDEVIRVVGSPDRAFITGNAEGAYFGVRPWGGSPSISMVNTTDPYEGRVRVPDDTLFLEIKAIGAWEITFE
jgi:uncharacterized membrane protein YqaE (UPF0057 family)